MAAHSVQSWDNSLLNLATAAADQAEAMDSNDFYEFHSTGRWNLHRTRRQFLKQFSFPHERIENMESKK